ncbi:MAG TPA: type II toxin-antitoxin system VapB family antitoxin [Phycicoccus sp.]|nr:type II toxin-antitoxin system VapB family antitoxin [Phycicoccus sp.]
MTVTKTPIEIDDDLLQAAAAALGTRTKKDTVNGALRHLAEEQRRLDALRELRAMGRAGDFDEFVGRSASYR